MKFASAYEPKEFETDVYAAWEAADEFLPGGKVDADEKHSTYSIVMPPPNANGNLHIGHGLTIAIEDSLTRYHRLRGETTWYIPGADHAGFETWVVYERVLEKAGHTRFEYSRDELYAQVWDFVQEQRGNMELQLWGASSRSTASFVNRTVGAIIPIGDGTCIAWEGGGKCSIISDREADDMTIKVNCRRVLGNA